MPEPGGLTSGTDPLDGPTADDYVALAGGSTEDELTGPDRGLEHSALYAVLFLVVSGGAMILGRPSTVTSITNPSMHTLMESIATLLGFLVGTLALVRYYSRKQITFLLIGCGFLGSAILDLNHLVGTIPEVMAFRGLENDQLMYAWTWTAGRVYLSLTATILAGRAEWPFVLAFLSVAIILGGALSLAAVALEELSFRRYPKLSDLIQLFGLAILENFGYRQLSAWWRLKGTISALRGVEGWGHMQRKGFTGADGEAT